MQGTASAPADLNRRAVPLLRKNAPLHTRLRLFYCTGKSIFCKRNREKSRAKCSSSDLLCTRKKNVFHSIFFAQQLLHRQPQHLNPSCCPGLNSQSSRPSLPCLFFSYISLLNPQSGCKKAFILIFSPLQLQKRLLRLDSSAKSGQTAVCSHNPVAGNDDSNGVMPTAPPTAWADIWGRPSSSASFFAMLP